MSGPKSINCKKAGRNCHHTVLFLFISWDDFLNKMRAASYNVDISLFYFELHLRSKVSIRMEWFWKNYTFHVVPNCCRTLIQKLHILMLLISLSHGLRKCGLLPWNHYFFTFLKPVTWGNVFFDFSEAKNSFPIVYIKHRLHILGKNNFWNKF